MKISCLAKLSVYVECNDKWIAADSVSFLGRRAQIIRSGLCLLPQMLGRGEPISKARGWLRAAAGFMVRGEVLKCYQFLQTNLTDLCAARVSS